MDFVRISTKKPWLATLLMMLFGPAGFLYLAWELALSSFLMLAVFVTALLPFGLDRAITIGWVRWLICGVLAYKAVGLIRTTRAPNGLADLMVIEAEIGSGLAFATMVMSDAMCGIAMILAAAGGLIASGLAFADGAVGRGLLMLILTPPFVYVARLLFGFLAFALDAIALGGRAAKAKAALRIARSVRA